MTQFPQQALAVSWVSRDRVTQINRWDSRPASATVCGLQSGLIRSKHHAIYVYNGTTRARLSNMHSVHVHTNMFRH